MPNELWQGVILSHWGRLDAKPFSNSAYGPDNCAHTLCCIWRHLPKHFELTPARFAAVLHVVALSICGQRGCPV